MKHQIPRGTAVALCLLTAVTTCQITLLACREGINGALPDYIAQQKLYTKLGEIQSLIEHNYVGEYDSEKLLDMAAAGMVVGTGDRWSSYLPKADYQSHQLNQEGALVGIGVSVYYDSDATALKIREVYPDSPAQAAGLQSGDEILAADGISVQEQGYAAVVQAVSGEADTAVTLQVQRAADGTAQTVTLNREKVSKTVVTAELLENHIGYIAIEDFDGGADTQFAAALEQLQQQGATAFVFDVRNNPGGLITVLVHILDPLLPEGEIVSLVEKDGTEKDYTSDSQALQLPMAVLVNAKSISAAELFAAVLQEYGVATVVGEQTIGKGFAQRTYPLSDGSALVLSDQKYYTPKGKNLANIGITPDVEVELTDAQEQNFYAMTKQEDTQLQAAIQAVQQTK